MYTSWFIEGKPTYSIIIIMLIINSLTLKTENWLQTETLTYKFSSTTIRLISMDMMSTNFDMFDLSLVFFSQTCALSFLSVFP